MGKKGVVVLLIVISAFCFLQEKIFAQKLDRYNTPPDIPRIEPITKDDKILILAPHPDDETLGAGGIIQEAVKAAADVRIAYLTNGEHNQLAFIVYEKRLVIKQKALIEMGKLRQREAIAAMGLLGVPEEKLIFLGYPDFGTLMIFLRYWGDVKPFKNMLTRVSRVPYDNALSPNAPYKGEAILWDIESILRKYKPTKIFVTNPVDTNRDHKALYLFLQVALWHLKDQIPEPKVYPYVIHCYSWPKPRRYHPSLYMNIPKALRNSQISWASHGLSPEEVQKKHQAILLYKSQYSDSGFYLNSFARQNELFGDYPIIDAARPRPLEVSKAKIVAYAMVEDSLLINIYMRETENRHRFYVNLAGYNQDVEFSQMPKIKINVDGKRVNVLDRGRFIRRAGLEVAQKRRSVTIKVPLEMLGEPNYILASADIHQDIFSADLNTWRVIKVK
jgi:LmbE family N-acetylglucosaminyl deacetylase